MKNWRLWGGAWQAFHSSEIKGIKCLEIREYKACLRENTDNLAEIRNRLNDSMSCVFQNFPWTCYFCFICQELEAGRTTPFPTWPPCTLFSYYRYSRKNIVAILGTWAKCPSWMMLGLLVFLKLDGGGNVQDEVFTGN